jgi:hypothetical protein
VDLTAAQIQNVNFTEAVLTGANLNGAVISSAPSGIATNFSGAFLQGTALDGARFENAPDLRDAFVDFTAGNSIYILLDGRTHNQFAQFACDNCRPPTGSPVCVFVSYPGPTRVPEKDVLMRCPSGGVPDYCGLADGSNTKWESQITDLANPTGGIPPAWYLKDSTYINAPADTNSRCKAGNNPPIAPTLFW